MLRNLLASFISQGQCAALAGVDFDRTLDTYAVLVRTVVNVIEFPVMLNRYWTIDGSSAQKWVT